MAGRERIDKHVFHDVMKALAALYPRFELSKDTLSAYYAILHDLPADLLKAATIEYGSGDHAFFPSAGKLRQLAFDIVDQANGKLNASEAWGKVIKQASTVGHRREPEFDEVIVYKAIEAVGGWRHICLGPEKMLASTRARFIEAFKRFRQDERKEERMLPQVREVAAQLGAGERPALEDKEE